MVKGENIIVFSSGDWQMGPSTPQHISKIFAKQNKVLFIETFGSRVPSLEKDHIKRIAHRLLNWPKGIKKLDIGGATIYIYSPTALLANYRPLLPLNRFIFLSLIKHLIKRLDMKYPIFYFYLPPPEGIIGKLHEKAIIYHSMDEWSTFPVGKNKVFMDAEKNIVENADLVLAANEYLYQSKKPYARRIHKLYHGVDYEHFAKEFSKDTLLPEDIKNLPKPIIAVIGVFADWVDLDLIKLIAQRHRDYSIVSIGTVESNVDVSSLINMNNIYFLGQKDYSELPNYYRAIDAFIIPFLSTEHTKTCAPTRLYEHLSSGRPIIATDIPAVREVGEGLVDIASDRDDFVKKLEEALEMQNPFLVERRKALAKKNTWNSRAEEISRMIEEIIREKEK